MGQWYLVIIVLYALLALWALLNFKQEVAEIGTQWRLLKERCNVAEEIKWAILHSKLNWLVFIGTILLVFVAGVGIALAPFAALFILWRGISRAELPNPGPFLQAVAMFLLDFFFTTGGAGIVELGQVVGTGGATFGGGLIVVLISNIMSHLFFLPKKTTNSRKRRAAYA